jgi:hypothetical protein
MLCPREWRVTKFEAPESKGFLPSGICNSNPNGFFSTRVTSLSFISESWANSPCVSLWCIASEHQEYCAVWLFMVGGAILLLGLGLIVGLHIEHRNFLVVVCMLFEDSAQPFCQSSPTISLDVC